MQFIALNKWLSKIIAFVLIWRSQHAKRSHCGAFYVLYSYNLCERIFEEDMCVQKKVTKSMLFIQHMTIGYTYTYILAHLDLVWTFWLPTKCTFVVMVICRDFFLSYSVLCTWLGVNLKRLKVSRFRKFRLILIVRCYSYTQ